MDLLEQHLREVLHRQADQAPDGPSLDAVRAAARRRRVPYLAIVTPLVAAAAVVVAFVVTGAGHQGSVRQSPGPVGQETTIPTATPILGSIWSQIGPGWFLATSSTQAASAGTGIGRITSTRLLLIGPDGSSHLVTTFPGSLTVQAWSGDGRRALVQTLVPSAISARTSVLDLQSQTLTPVQAPPDVSIVGFTRPDGRALLTLSTKPSSPRGTYPALYRLERRSLTGADPVVLSNAASGTAPVVYSQDGSELFVAGAATIAVITNDGASAGVVPNSSGCQPVRLWDATELLATCGMPGTASLQVLPLAGGPARLIAKDTNAPFAHQADAYPAADGAYTRTEGACSSEWVGRVTAKGTVTPVNFPGQVPFDQLLTSDGTRIAVQVITTCGTPAALRYELMWTNPQTGDQRILWTAPAGEIATFDPFPTYNGIE